MEKLSENEKLVLSACVLSAHRSMEAIARQVNLSERSVRYAIQNMLSRGIIEPRHYLDVFRLGLSSYVVLFSLRPLDISQREKIVTWLAKLPGVVWFAEVGGDYEFILNICVGDVRSLMELFDQVGEKFGEAFSKKVFAQHFSYRDYSYSFLDDHQFTPDFVGTAPRAVMPNFDATDHAVLREIAARPLSYRELSQRTGIPAATVQYRIEKLKKEGVIKRTIFLVNHSILGYSSMLMLIYAKVFDRRLRQALHEFALSSRNVVTVTESLGSWDFELSAIARSPTELRALRDQIATEFSGKFELISSVPMYRLIRWNQYPFETYEDYVTSISPRERSVERVRIANAGDRIVTARKNVSNI